MKKKTNIGCRPPLGRRVWLGVVLVGYWVLRPFVWLAGVVTGFFGVVEFYRKALGFRVRRSDIFIATYPRSGTTWMQMIMYQLTTGGEMDFMHISERVPFFERFREAALLPGTFRGKGRGKRRVFKTHLSYRMIPKGPCKYIYVVRDGRDAAVSYYFHYRNLIGFTGTFAEFFELYMKGDVQCGSWFKHVSEWKRNPSGLDVLYLTYDELKKDLPGVVRRIGEFCRLELSEEDFERVVERSGFEYMKRHEDKFEHITERLMEQGARFGEFLRQGKSGGWNTYFTKEQESRFDEEARKYTVK